MPSSCKEIRAALAQCLQESDCVMVQRHSAAECMREPLVETLPPRCQQLRKGFGECRRGMIDMRKRFRGNQPAAAKLLAAHDAEARKAAEGGGDNGNSSQSAQTGYQLYAGRRAFASTARETSGDEKAPSDWREVENEKYRQAQQKK